MDYQFKGKGLKSIVENDVWIGYGAIVISGIHSVRGAIVAVGSVVLKDIESYTTVAGNPEKVVSRRFDDEQIREHEKQLKIHIQR